MNSKWTREKEKMKMRAGISRPSSHGVMIMFSLVVITSCCLIAVKGGACRASGSVRGRKPPPGKCNKENNSDCCKQGQLYPIFRCSPPVTKPTKATLTLNSSARGGDGGGASECDGKFHSDDTPVAALSTGWFNQSIIIFGNGRWRTSVTPQKGVTQSMISLITWWMLLKQFGRRWEWPTRTGATFRLNGLMHGQEYMYV